MGYVRVTGGQEAIAASESVADYFRLRNAQGPLAVSEIRTQMRLLIDRIMGEAGFYAPDYAALAVKQSEGDALEAAFMLRAYRSTLERLHRAVAIDTDHMHIIRRISSAFRNVPGGQVLGPTYDYTHRWLRFALWAETPEHIQAALAKAEKLTDDHHPLDACARVSDSLRKEGLLSALPENRADDEPYDITREKLLFPAPRSARLQTLARGETGVLTALAYSSMRGYGAVHPTVGELRVGFAELWIEYPYGE
ncbi:MAG: carbon-phosphorus lyase complex subunit PhnI, partial [Firmicutes bacterium]|nr:carbon-phosphorus lyase complex subunit PhnI [Bacillota bacterium]